MTKNLKMILILSFVLCLPLLAACGNENDNMGNTTSGMTETTTAAGEGNTMQSQNTGTVSERRDYGSYYVYTPNSDRSGLMRDEVQYTRDYAEDFGGMVRESLSELFDRSGDDYLPLASNEENIKSISLNENGILVIDFDPSFAASIADFEMPDNATIYSLVNTLAQYSTIRSVLFTVNGEPLTVNDTTYSEPFTEDPNLVMD